MAHDDAQPISQLQVALPGTDEPIPPALLASTEYEVIREINRGAMGVVYLVRNRRMDRLEGLKVIQESLLKQASALERFEREMRSAARLNHPSIVTAYASPPLPGLLAFAMEFVDGTDLYSLVRARGPLPVSNACYYAFQVAQGLQHAHEEQMVHRDIKPNNLMLKCTGDRQIVKILDFGLAKATSERASNGGLTGTGQMMGTPHYMSPEQIADAAKAGIRADIYSLGCTLYHLLSGHPPFRQHAGLYDILHAHKSETAPSLDELRPDVPAGLAAIVAKMMAKDMAQRHQTPAEVAQALARFFQRGIDPIPCGDTQFPQAAAADSQSAKSVETEVGKPQRAVPANSETPSTRPANLATAMPAPATLVAVVEPNNQPTPDQSASRQRRGAWKQSVPGTGKWGVTSGLLIVVLLFVWKIGAFDKGEKAERVDVADTSKNGIPTAGLAEQEFKSAEPAADTPSESAGNPPRDMPALAKEPSSSQIASKVDSSPASAPTVTITKNAFDSGDVPPSDKPAAAKRPAPAQIARMSDWPRIPGRPDSGLIPAKFTNSLDMELVLIPAGKFRMGSPASEKDRSDDEVQADVTLKKAFYLGKTEVTQGQWRAVMGTTPWQGEKYAKEGDNYAATYVSWDDAQTFCKKLSERENSNYRLPTEAEWEFACRGGTTTRFSFGNDDSRLGEFAWYDKNAYDAGEKYAHEVGLKPADRFGLHDMHGNVWEWCEDVYMDNFPGWSDPLVSAGGSTRVIRGGSWFITARRCRSANRSRLAPSSRSDDMGFRVAWSGQ